MARDLPQSIHRNRTFGAYCLNVRPNASSRTAIGASQGLDVLGGAAGNGLHRRQLRNFIMCTIHAVLTAGDLRAGLISMLGDDNAWINVSCQKARPTEKKHISQTTPSMMRSALR
jgi:hypothetical protein